MEIVLSKLAAVGIVLFVVSEKQSVTSTVQKI